MSQEFVLLLQDLFSKSKSSFLSLFRISTSKKNFFINFVRIGHPMKYSWYGRHVWIPQRWRKTGALTSKRRKVVPEGEVSYTNYTMYLNPLLLFFKVVKKSFPFSEIFLTNKFQKMSYDWYHRNPTLIFLRVVHPLTNHLQCHETILKVLVSCRRGDTIGWSHVHFRREDDS